MGHCYSPELDYKARLRSLRHSPLPAHPISRPQATLQLVLRVSRPSYYFVTKIVVLLFVQTKVDGLETKRVLGYP